MSPNEFPDSIPDEVREWWESLRVERNILTPELDITYDEFSGVSDEVWNELREQIGFDFGENLPMPQAYADQGSWSVHMSIPDDWSWSDINREVYAEVSVQEVTYGEDMEGTTIAELIAKYRDK